MLCVLSFVTLGYSDSQNATLTVIQDHGKVWTNDNSLSLFIGTLNGRAEVTPVAVVKTEIDFEYEPASALSQQLMRFDGGADGTFRLDCDDSENNYSRPVQVWSDDTICFSLSDFRELITRAVELCNCRQLSDVKLDILAATA